MYIQYSSKFPNGLGLNLTTDLQNYNVYYRAAIEIYNTDGTEPNNTQITEINNILDTHIPQAPFLISRDIIGTTPNIMLNLISGLQSVVVPSNAVGNQKLLYFSVIPDLSELTTAIANYTEPVQNIPVYLEKEPNTGLVITNNMDLIKPVQPDEIIVSKNAGMFNSIVEAINYINTLVNPTVVIRVYPGIYYETQSIVLPFRSCLYGEGSAGNTIIVGAHNNPVIYTSEFNSVKNLNIIGGSCGIWHDGSNSDSFCMVEKCLIKIMDLNNLGIYISGGRGSLVASHVSIYADPITPGTYGTGSVIRVNGGSAILTETIIQCQSNIGIELSNSILSLDITSAYYCKTAITVNNQSIIKATLINVINCETGLNLTPNTPEYTNNIKSKISVNYLHLDNCVTDVNINENAILELYSGHINTKKITQNTFTNLSGIFYGIYNNKLFQILNGESFIKGNLTFGEQKTDYTTFSNGVNYISTQTKICSFKTTNIITQILYYNGSTWENLDFIKNGTDYWLDLEYNSVITQVNGVSAHWLQIVGAITDVFDIYDNVISISRDNLMFYGCSRKINIIYLDISQGNKYFIEPEYLDKSTALEIVVNCDSATIAGSALVGPIISKKIKYNNFNKSNNLLYFNIIGVNITMIAVKYYVIQI